MLISGGWLRSRTGRLIPALVLIAALGACQATYRNHGFIPFAEDLSQLTPGVHSREAVLQTLGSPTAQGALTSDTAYYVSSRFRHYAFMAPEEIERTVLAVSFDERGLLRNMETFGLADGQVVVLSRRITDDGIRDRTFVRQLLGNIGRINPEQFFGE